MGPGFDDIYLEVAAGLARLAGAPTEEIRLFRRVISTRLKPASTKVVMTVARRLIDEFGFTGRFVAYELIQHHKEAASSIREKDLKKLGVGMNSWGAVDTFACHLSGPAWRNNQVSDDVIAGWARSKDRWWRRAALVSTVPLNNTARGGSGDPKRTLAIAEMLVDDRDDMVVKAMSWALRELAKKDAQAVASFLKSNLNRLSPRVIREVNNKLTTGLKNPKTVRN